MTIAKKINESECVISISGRLTTITSSDLEQELKSENLIERINSLSLDFANLDYISSSGLRIVLWANKILSKKGGLKIVNASKEIKDIFEVTGFSNILKIE